MPSRPLTSDRKNLSKGKRDVFQFTLKKRGLNNFILQRSLLCKNGTIFQIAQGCLSAPISVFQDENLNPALIKTIDYQVDALYYKTDNLLDENKINLSWIKLFKYSSSIQTSNYRL
ncbi:MAG: hypothetical protein IPJ64_13890 [Saprospiraceae bacterium]|nr:hypothetical protein [Saprospiraceae bacterium]